MRRSVDGTRRRVGQPPTVAIIRRGGPGTILHTMMCAGWEEVLGAWVVCPDEDWHQPALLTR